MLRTKTMRTRTSYNHRGGSSGVLSPRVLAAAFWVACVVLLLLVVRNLPSSHHTVVTETVTIKATLSHSTVDGTTSTQQHSGSTAAVTGELSDTSDADWEPPHKRKEAEAAAAAAAEHTEHAAASEEAEASGEHPPHFTSTGRIYAVPASNGLPIKYYYKFQNVKLTRDALYFYHGAGFKRPKNVWVDFVSGNLTQPTLPNVIVVKGEVKKQMWYYLPVKYLNVANNEANCNGWIEKPVYLLQARYSYNIWHTWNEGLMGAFQTLREQGYLPLVQVDADGNMREVTEGMGPKCPLVWDPLLNATRPEEDCTPKTGVVGQATCDTKNQAWCREGVVSYLRFDGPMILPYTATSVMNKWSQIYAAMTEDVRDWSHVDGWCFRNLIVGKTSTLNFYQPVNTSTGIDSHRAERVEAMSVFKRFVTTAQRDFVRSQRAGNPLAKEGKRYKGYKDKRLEALRQGVGPENLTAAAWIQPRELPMPLLPEELGKIQRLLASTGLPLPYHEMLLIPKRSGARRHLNHPGMGLSRRMRQRHLLQEAEAGEAAAEGAGVAAAAADEEEDAEEHPVERQEQVALAEAQRAEEGEHADAEEGTSDPGPERPHQEEAAEHESSEHGAAAAAGTAVQQPQVEQPQAEQPQVAAVGEEHPADVHDHVANEAQEAAQLAADREAALGRMPPLLPAHEGFQLEQPRPVVTYMSRNFFSRGVLNEQDILEYILSRYNVTLRVTSLEEPLLEVMNLLGRTDVLIGMHGAGWTNGIFLKHGATCLQMFPYGWRLPDGSTIRGHNYREIVLASETPYVEWVNSRWDTAFFRRQDFQRRWNTPYRFQPDPPFPLPKDGWPGNFWIYQNTYVDMASFGPAIDEAMAKAGIRPMPQGPLPLPRPVERQPPPQRSPAQQEQARPELARPDGSGAMAATTTRRHGRT